MLGTHSGMVLHMAVCPVLKPDSNSMQPHYCSYSWDQSLNKVHNHLVKHYANVCDLSPQAACWTAPSLTPKVACVKPGQREGFLRTVWMMQVVVVVMIMGLHASDSMQDCCTGVATTMQCTLAQ